MSTFPKFPKGALVVSLEAPLIGHKTCPRRVYGIVRADSTRSVPVEFEGIPWVVTMPMEEIRLVSLVERIASLDSL